jgi:hypothetical protein
VTLLYQIGGASWGYKISTVSRVHPAAYWPGFDASIPAASTIFLVLAY